MTQRAKAPQTDEQAQNKITPPVTGEAWQDELNALMEAETTEDALRKLREWKQRRILLWAEPDGRIGIARLSVRQVNELVELLEGRTIG